MSAFTHRYHLGFWTHPIYDMDTLVLLLSQTGHLAHGGLVTLQPDILIVEWVSSSSMSEKAGRAQQALSIKWK